MKKILFLIISCLAICSESVIAQQNIQLLGSYQFSGQSLSGCWHYTDSLGREYGIIGAQQGIAFLDITQPANPQFLFQLPGNNSIWHEVKVSGHYAYAVSEGVDTAGIKNGVQIMDLRYLPDSVPYKFWQGDGFIQGQLQKAHSITVDSNYIYINGHNITALGNGVLICSIANPWNPAFVGAVTNFYCHDSYVRGNRLYTSDIFNGQFSIYDIVAPSNPILLATQSTPNHFNHNTWLNDAGTVIFTTDEQNGSPVASYDISDVNNITLLDQFYNQNLPNKEVHNVRVINDYLINPSYGSQLTIADVSRPGNIIEIGNYPTGSYLCWDADPYLSSGAILATDMYANTVFLFQPDYKRACYLEGTVIDSVTHLPLNGVSVTLSGAISSKSSNITGNYTTGIVNPGIYDATYSKNGYRSKTISNISLQSGVLTIQDLELAPSNIGVNEIEMSDFLSFSPNPATGYLSVNVKQREPIVINLMNLTGQTLFRTELSEGLHQLNLTAIPAGMYTIRLNGAGNVKSEKLLLMR